MQEAERVRKIERLLLALLLSLTFVRGCLYIALTPPWQAPDENGHFEYAWLIAHLRRLPAVGESSPTFEEELVSSLYEWRYGKFIGRPLPPKMPAHINELPQNLFAVRSRSALGRFSLAYIWTALFIWPLRHQDLLIQLYAARLSSLVLNLGIIWLAWHIFKALMSGQPNAVAAMTAFVVFLPQHTFINSAVGDGPLAELSACIVLYGWLRLILSPFRWQHLLTVFVGTLLGIWTKRTVAFLIPLDIVMLIVFYRLAFYREPTCIGRLIVVTLAVLTIFIFMVAVSKSTVGHWMYTVYRQWEADPRFYWKNERVSLDQVIRYTFESFWAQFGWMNVRAGYGWYLLVYILIAFAIEGWVMPRSRFWGVLPPMVWLMGLALLLAIGGWLAFTITYPTGLAYCQGRYLFPVTVPVAFFIVGGWMRNVPLSFQRLFLPFIIILLSALDMAALCLSFWPYFYNF
ncbi:MAG: DUF2142 domain-containing protein [Candidatus Bathyarchaeia archaeon]